MAERNIKFIEDGSSISVMILLKVIPIFYFILFIVSSFLFPQYFTWITNLKLFLISALLMLAYQSIAYLIVQKYKIQSFWTHLGFVFTIFYGFMIYTTGNLDSSFMFMMVFIPIISSSYLNLRLSRDTGIFSIIVLASLIFFDKSHLVDPVYIIKHSLHVLLYSLMVFYMYRIIKEILLEKYEKEQLKRKFIEINEINDVKKIFLTAMSHQLKTPLSSARWALEESLNDKNGPNIEMIKEAKSRIVRSIGILTEILKTAEFDLSDISSIELTKKPFSLNSEVKHIVDNLGFLTQVNGTKTIYDMPDEIEIKGDEKMLDLALSNIFDNAFRYSPKGTIKVSLRKGDNEARLIVEDNGIGIDSADMEYVFQKFFRGKNAMHLDPNESGVGLYATKKIIEMHNGDIKISSILNKGTKVEVILPIDYI